MNYAQLLENSFARENETERTRSRLEYLSDNIFDFTTYDSGISEMFAKKAVEVCNAINKSLTFEYIGDEENYLWFLLMCNMPFFENKLSWGTSIRGAWWDGKEFELKSCGLWVEFEQMTSFKFSIEEWYSFIDALVEFSRR